MGRLSVDALEPGMVLASDLLGSDGKMLLPKGMTLTDSLISSLRKRGVPGADIDEGVEDAGAAEIDEVLLKESAAHVARRFLAGDLSHPALAALFEAAVMLQARALAAGEPILPDVAPNPRAESMGDLFFRAEGGVEDLVDSEVKLASFPDIYFKIRQVLDSPVSSAAQVADVIGKDTSLTAKLLKLVNSPFYGLPHRVDSISRAVMVLGSQEVSTLALGISAMNAFKDIPPELINMRTFWEHSMAVGVYARLLGAAVAQNGSERLFVAGVLHDIGRLVIFKKLPHAAVEAIYYAKANMTPLCLAETEVLGFSHPLIGGLLLKAWKFPEALVATVSCHHTPSACPGDVEAAILHLADIMAVALGHTPPASVMVPPLEPAAWDVLRLDPARLGELAEQGQSQIDDIVGAFFPARKN
ncbi:MAG: HDOD domain-containing protein [Solidesulfovibrio sp.]|uniref:HDOD domain-containing protein n=1 Tax=Solidesulfovibrio sp. TaxID=2910990 RepID=UPI002B21DCE7|nr:HDOD domain-containing protein [Solidesulfovibrio sp.]MEA4857265.1 HDOD domain-containing protein [Solidesulfovibrio sp.]